jgi:hypothetical protein
MGRSGCDFVCSEENLPNILTKNVPKKLLAMHGRRSLQNGTLCCRREWHEIVEAIELTDKTIHHVQWEQDVKLWIQQQSDEDRWSKLLMTFRDDYVMCHDSFDATEPRFQLCYV